MQHKRRVTTKERTKKIFEYDSVGNVVDEHDVMVLMQPNKKPNQYFQKGTFCLMSKELARKLRDKRKEYGVTTYALIFELIDRVDYNNRIKTFRQDDLAETLNTSKSIISRNMKKIRADGIIYKKDHDYYFEDKYIKYAEKK